jgi:hypothetical protein
VTRTVEIGVVASLTLVMLGLASARKGVWPLGACRRDPALLPVSTRFRL